MQSGDSTCVCDFKVFVGLLLEKAGNQKGGGVMGCEVKEGHQVMGSWCRVRVCVKEDPPPPRLCLRHVPPPGNGTTAVNRVGRAMRGRRVVFDGVWVRVESSSLLEAVACGSLSGQTFSPLDFRRG